MRSYARDHSDLSAPLCLSQLSLPCSSVSAGRRPSGRRSSLVAAGSRSPDHLHRTATSSGERSTLTHTIWAGCWYVVCGLYFCRAALWEAYIAWKEWGMVYLKLWVANLVMLAIPINGHKLVASLSVCHMVSNPRNLLICALIFFLVWYIFEIFL